MAIITEKEKNKLKPIERKIKKNFLQKQVPQGKEICEVQLYKLIDKIHDIEVNEKEIKDYLPSVYQKLHDLDREELIKRFVSIEFNQFLSYYENAHDLNKDTGSGRKQFNNEDFTRFYINQGKMDNLTPARLMGLINEQLRKRNIEIGQIEILKSFSFFEIDKNYTDDVLETMNACEFNNRRVIVEVTSKSRGGRRKGKSKGFGRKDFKQKFKDSDQKRQRDFKPGKKTKNSLNYTPCE